MTERYPNFWWIALDDNTVKFFDDETQVTREVWEQRASKEEVEKLHRVLIDNPEFIPAVPQQHA